MFFFFFFSSFFVQIENGLKANTGFISIYESKNAGSKTGDAPPSSLGMEVENVEVLMTDQGLYIYKAYGCGHKYTLWPVWMLFFRALLVSGYVPGIILPLAHPDPLTFGRIARLVHLNPELIGSSITLRDDLFGDSPSYWDHPCTTVKDGYLYLTPDNIGSLDQFLSDSAPGQRRELTASGRIVNDDEGGGLPLNNVLRASSDLGFAVLPRHFQGPQAATALKKDLTGRLLSKVMVGVRGLTGALDRHTSAVLGKFIAAYLGKCVKSGASDEGDLEVGFSLALGSSDHDELLTQVLALIGKEIDELRYATDLVPLLKEAPEHFFELRIHLLNTLSHHAGGLSAEQREALQRRKRETAALLDDRLELVAFTELDAETRRAVMKWVYRNEDTVWRNRGGRPADETIDQFLAMLDHDARCHYPGTLVRSEVMGKKQVVGYLVGQIAGLDGWPQATAYEIVTAWVDPQYRGLNLASKMYGHCFETVSACPSVTHIYFDIIESSMHQIVSASPMFVLLTKLGLDRLLLLHRGHQYTATISEDRATGDKKQERFERLVLSAMALRFCFALARRPRKHLIVVASGLVLCLALLLSLLNWPLLILSMVAILVVMGVMKTRAR